VEWGEYTAAISRWSSVLGRPAPYPTEPGRTGRPRLAAVFVEWLMGLPQGWVTGVAGVSRTAQLRALGNGVIPAQAATAVTLLLRDALADSAITDSAITHSAITHSALTGQEVHPDSDPDPGRQTDEAVAA